MQSASVRASWFVNYRPRPRARLRLFCFPYAGGGASIFRAWPNNSPLDLEVCPVQLPGRENRLLEPPFSRLSALIDSLTKVLLPYLDLPFAIFGHSMGALISFELTRELRRQHGLNPAMLFVSAHRAPQVPDAKAPIHHLPETTFLEKLRRLGGASETALENAELMRLMLPTLRADFALCENYHYTSEDPIRCPISAFGGLQDREVSERDLAAWRYQTQSAFMLRMFPGGHLFLNLVPRSIVRAITDDLSELVWAGAGE